MNADRDVIQLGPGEGRSYDMGKLQATFKADESETDNAYAASEWHLQPGHTGVGAHSHDANDEIFYVLKGSVEFLIGTEWICLAEGSFLRIPAGTTHDFRNLGQDDSSVFNIFIPGGFEHLMPSIVDWFAENQPNL